MLIKTKTGLKDMNLRSLLAFRIILKATGVTFEWENSNEKVMRVRFCGLVVKK